MLIAILEDNADRVAAMTEWLVERLGMYETFVTADPDVMIAILHEREADLLFVSLDHDLFEGPDPDATGMPVAEYLATRPPVCPVVVHSSNTLAAESMVRILKRADWTAQRVIPFEDTAWVGDDWFPTLRRLLRSYKFSTRTRTAPGAVASVP